MEKLASAIDSASNNKWDFISRTSFGAFERQVRNTLVRLDLSAVIDNDMPTLEDVAKQHPSADADERERILEKVRKEFKTADMAVHPHIDNLLQWKCAPARLTEMAQIEKDIGRPSGRALWLFIQKVRSKTSYQDQASLKRDLAAIEVPYIWM